MLTEVFKVMFSMLVIALDILVIALASPGGSEMADKTKIYRVHFRDGTSKFVAAKSGRGLVGLYAQRVSPKRG